MTRTVVLSQFMPYGAPELQSVARPYMVRALLLSTALCTLLYAALALVSLFPRTNVDRPQSRVWVLEPPVPSSIAPPTPVPPVAPAGLTHVTAGIALPVPDEQAAPEATIADADQLRTALPGSGTGDLPVVVEQPVQPETLPGRTEYVYVDEMPAPVHSVSPEYPALAREAGVSGVVVAYLLVGKDGRVLAVQIDEKHSILMLNEVAIEAARQWVFKPALTNNRPVAVWVAVPFNFHLQ